MTKKEQDKENIIKLVEEKLPDFAKMVKTYASKKGDKPTIYMHQDAFAAEYNIGELVLLGSAVKYAGINGLTIAFMGLSNETLRQSNLNKSK